MKFLFGFCLITFCNNIYGYDYVKDILYYQEDTLFINQIPLDSCFADFIRTESINYHDGAHMKCHEGYRVWELKNDSLFLNNVLNCKGDEMLSKDSTSILKMEYGYNKLFAYWVNGKIYNPYGKFINRISDYPIYEFDREFEITEGKLQQVINYDNRASKTSIYQKEIDSLNRLLYNSLNWDLLESYKCDLDRTMVINFRVNNQRKPVDFKILRGLDANCDSEILRVVKTIPEWGLYYVKGKPVEVRWNLPIKLSRLKS